MNENPSLIPRGHLPRRRFLAAGWLATGAAWIGSAEEPSAPAPPPVAAQCTGELTVAACQILTSSDIAESTAKIVDWTERAARAGADVVAFPEAALCGYECRPEYWREARPEAFAAGEAAVAETARRHHIGVVVGSAHWEDGRVRNSLLVIDRDGSVRGRYAKTYLAEDWPAPGRRLPVYRIAGAPCCFLICHDERYPELVRLPVLAGAQLCFLCSNESGLLQEEKLSAYRAMPIARATENGIFLVMTNAPADPDRLRSPSQSHGNSKIVHPDGRVLVEAGHFEQRLVSARIDLRKASRWVARKAARDGALLAPWLRAGLRFVDQRA